MTFSKKVDLKAEAGVFPSLMPVKSRCFELSAEECELKNTLQLRPNTASSPHMTTGFRESNQHRVMQQVYSHASSLSSFI